MFNYNWIEKKLHDLGYEKDPVTDAVIELFYTLDSRELPNRDDEAVVVDLFKSVFLQIPSLNLDYTSSNWKDFSVGNTVPGAIVRVRKEVYTGAGSRHNGLVGTLVAVRGGRAVVQYIGRSDGVGHTHDPSNLEVLDK